MTRNTARIIGTSMLAVAVLALCALPLVAQEITVNHAVASGQTAPLRELMKLPQPVQYGFHLAEPYRRIAKRDFGKSVDPVEQRGSAPSTNYSIIANFLGVGHGFPGYQVPDAPPDTNMAVGDTQVLQWVNVSYTICSKTSPYTCGPAIIGNTLWANGIPGSMCANSNDGDIIAQFDQKADRWYLAQNVFSSPYAVCYAISDTNDATGTWHVWQFPVPGAGFPDYPKWGTWPTSGVNNGYYQAWNNFGPGGSGFMGPKICAYDRAAILAHAANPTQICFQLTAGEDSLLPGDLDSIFGVPNTPAGTPQDDFYIGSVGDVDNSHLSLYQFHADFTTPSNSFVMGSHNSILQPVPTYTGSCSGGFGGDCVPQKGITDKADSLGDRLMYRFAYWNDGPAPSGPPCAICATPHFQHWYVNGDVEASGGNIGPRWYEFRAPPVPGIGTLTSTTLNTHQAGTYAPDGNWRWMASIAQDKAGDIMLGYSESCGSTCPGGTPGGVYPSVYITGRTVNDPVGLSNMEAETRVVAGSGSQPDTSDRWGDYSAMRIDPTDHCTFWYTQEFYEVTQSFDWSTKIASAKFSNCH
ncbi:MAG: hypothetical protein ABSC64_18375 [Candidatus Korobacteraceae bacterium]|jgi:hypothetical protein